jgi:hypothetical protein
VLQKKDPGQVKKEIPFAMYPCAFKSENDIE